MEFEWEPTYTEDGLMLLQPNACCCGVATCYNVLRLYGIEITFDEVLDETEPYRENDGTMSMPDIWDFLEDYDFTLDGFVHGDILDAELAAGNIVLIYVDARVLSIPIESFDIKTSKTIKRYPSTKAAERDGYNKCNISGCINGRQKTHRGLGWRRLTTT